MDIVKSMPYEGSKKRIAAGDYYNEPSPIKPDVNSKLSFSKNEKDYGDDTMKELEEFLDPNVLNDEDFKMLGQDTSKRERKGKQPVT